MDLNLQQISSSQDPTEICSVIQDVITKHLDKQVPLKKIQTTTKVPAFTTPTTRELISERYKLLEIAKQMDNQTSWRQYRNIRNRAHKSLASDKKQYTKINSVMKTKTKISGIQQNHFLDGRPKQLHKSSLTEELPKPPQMK